MSRRSVIQRVWMGAILVVVSTAALCSGPAVWAGPPSGETGAPVASPTPPEGQSVVGAAADDAEARVARARAQRARALRDDEEEDQDPGLGSLFSSRSGLLGTALGAIAFYFLFLRGRGAAGSGIGNWGSYYLFWFVAPLLLAIVSSHPAVLLVMVVGLIARRWLPDPFLALKYATRIRALEVDVNTNPGNVTARRDLATIWLERRRPRRALPLVEQALGRDQSSSELLYLQGVAQLQLGQHEQAVQSLVSVVHKDPGFRYGEAYLRAGDALAKLGRWEDAEEALDHFLKINGSSIEGHLKRVKVRRARKDEAGARQARQDLRDAWRSLPSYQRRHQLGWYLRALLLR